MRIVSKADIDFIAELTACNDHFGSLISIANVALKDYKLGTLLEGLTHAHHNLNAVVGETAYDMRFKLYQLIKTRLKNEVANANEVLAAL